jgi:hypothetical protein
MLRRQKGIGFDGFALFVSFITGGAPPVGLFLRNKVEGRGQKAEGKRI